MVSKDKEAGSSRERPFRAGLIIKAIRLGLYAHHARLYVDRNGRGETYYSMKYYERPDPLGPPVPRTLYLGRLEPWLIARLKKAVAANAAQRAARKARSHQLESHRDRIVVIRLMIHDAMRHARQSAKDCGFYFKGVDLRRKRV